MEVKKFADYCLNCKTKPCSKACPLGNNIPEFIKCVKEDNILEAYKVLSETTIMPSICGRICPHSKQCQGSCVRGIKGSPVEIGKIEAYVGDYALEHNIKYSKLNKIDKSVAILGGGPAGLTAATFLAKQGLDVTIYEKENYLGGLLVHGIPEFRLDKNIVKKVIDNILDLGVKFSYEKFNDKNYDAIILSFGANEPISLGIDGEDLNGVFGANTLLKTNHHPDYTNKSVIVIGGGNVAMDAARTINKLGAKKVSIIYRRDKKNMPAETKEIKDAENEGIEFIFQTSPVRILGENKVHGIECIKTELIKDENSTREIPIDIPNSNFNLQADFIVVAIGATTNNNSLSLFNLKTNKNGYIEIDENNMTSKTGIFAAGDLCGTKSTVAWACRSGRDTAYSVIDYLCN